MKDKREKIVIKTSIISIVLNIILAGFKAGVGIISNSIAIISDAVNNLSDAFIQHYNYSWHKTSW